jgi:hypothetical protein
MGKPEPKRPDPFGPGNYLSASSGAVLENAASQRGYRDSPALQINFSQFGTLSHRLRGRHLGIGAARRDRRMAPGHPFARRNQTSILPGSRLSQAKYGTALTVTSALAGGSER